MPILISFFNVQALWCLWCLSSSQSTVHHCVWRLNRRSICFYYQWKHFLCYVVGEERATHAALRCLPLHLLSRFDSGTGNCFSHCMLRDPSQVTVTTSRPHRWTGTVWLRLANFHYPWLETVESHSRCSPLSTTRCARPICWSIQGKHGNPSGSHSQDTYAAECSSSFFRARPIPYTLCNKVNTELER